MDNTRNAFKAFRPKCLAVVMLLEETKQGVFLRSVALLQTNHEVAKNTFEMLEHWRDLGDHGPRWLTSFY